MNSETIKYDPTRSALSAGNVQDAIDTLADTSLRTIAKALSSNDDLNVVFEEGIYAYTNTCANIPASMGATGSYAGRLIVLHTTDVHITQIALPSQRVYDVFMRHYSSNGDEYTWSSWYSVSFNVYKQSISSVPYSYGGSDFLLRCFGKPINPSNFANSAFEVTAISRNGYSAKYTVVISDVATITRIDGNSAAVHPQLGKTNSNNIYIRMADDSAATQPSSTETIDLLVVKVR